MDYKIICTELTSDITHKAQPQAHHAEKIQPARWTEALLDAYRKARDTKTYHLNSLNNRYAQEPEQRTGSNFYLYVDATFNNPAFSFVVGYVIFDHIGRMWGVGYHRIQPPGTIMNAELHAIKDGLSFWMQHKQGRSRILSDSIEAIHSIHSDQTYKGVEEFLISNIKELVKDTSVEGVIHCQRSNNTIAHNLAKIATKSPHPQA